VGSIEPPLNSDKRGDDRRTDYDANCPKGRIPTFCAVISYARHDGISDWRAIAPEPETAIGLPPQLPCTAFATVLMGQYPAIVSERLRQRPKMVSWAGFASFLHYASLRHRIVNDLSILQCICPFAALFGHVAMSDVSPNCEPKRTSTARSDFGIHVPARQPHALW
jgi:hypothetical protein